MVEPGLPVFDSDEILERTAFCSVILSKNYTLFIKRHVFIACLPKKAFLAPFKQPPWGRNHHYRSTENFS
jgi:hypothetical protein